MRCEAATLELMVEDVPRALTFWTERLGFAPLAAEPEAAPTWGLVGLPDGGVRVAFKQAARLRGEFDWFDGQSQGATAMIVLDVDDLHAWHAEISRRFALIDHPHITPCGATQFAIRCPDGYVVVFQRFEPPG